MCKNVDSPEPRQRRSDKLSSRAGFAESRLRREPRRSRIAHLARAQTRRHAADHDGVRSRSGCPGRHRPVLPGRALVARFVGQNEIEIVRQNEWLKRLTSLCAAQHASHIRSNEGSIARPCPASRRRTWRSCDFQHVEVGAQRKSVRRLEPERRTQNDHLRVLTSRQGRADRFHSSHLGRSGELPEKEKSRPPEISLRQNPRPRRKNGQPIATRRKTEEKTTKERTPAKEQTMDLAAYV